MQLNIFKQHNIKRIGGLLDVFYFTAPLLSVGGIIASGITVYTVTLPWTKPVAPWLSIQLFFGVAAVLCLGLMALMYKFVYKSYFAFRNNQEYRTDNPIRKHLERQDATLNEIKKHLGIK